MQLVETLSRRYQVTNDFKDRLVAQVQQYNKELQNIISPPPIYTRQDVQDLQAYQWTSLTDLIQKLVEPYHCIVSRSMYGSLATNPVFYRYFTSVNTGQTRGLLGVLRVSDTLVIPFLTDAYSKWEHAIFSDIVDAGSYILVPPDRQRVLE